MLWSVTMNALHVLEHIKVHGPKDFDYARLEKAIDAYIHASTTDLKSQKRKEKVYQTVKAIALTDYAEILRVRALPGFDPAGYEMCLQLFDSPQLFEHKAIVRCERSIKRTLNGLLQRLEKSNGAAEAKNTESPGSGDTEQLA